MRDLLRFIDVRNLCNFGVFVAFTYVVGAIVFQTSKSFDRLIFFYVYIADVTVAVMLQVARCSSQ